MAFVAEKYRTWNEHPPTVQGTSLRLALWEILGVLQEQTLGPAMVQILGPTLVQIPVPVLE